MPPFQENDPRLAGVPLECLREPFMELRPCKGTGTQTHWPYCTLCRKWSTTLHIDSDKHKRKLKEMGELRQDPPPPPAGVAPPGIPQPPGPEQVPRSPGVAATMPTPTLESAAAALKAASDVSVLPPGVVRPISLAERTIEAKIERLSSPPSSWSHVPSPKSWTPQVASPETAGEDRTTSEFIAAIWGTRAQVHTVDETGASQETSNSTFGDAAHETGASPLRPMRQAPQKPTPEEIYDWNLQGINFDWKTVERPEECEEC